MNITLTLAPLISLIAGILILVVPRLLNYIVAIYLILIGLIGMFGGSGFKLYMRGPFFGKVAGAGGGSLFEVMLTERPLCSIRAASAWRPDTLPPFNHPDPPQWRVDFAHERPAG